MARPRKPAIPSSRENSPRPDDDTGLRVISLVRARWVLQILFTKKTRPFSIETPEMFLLLLLRVLYDCVVISDVCFF